MKKIDLNSQNKMDTGFKVPQNYFETFDNRMIDKITTNLSAKQKRTQHLQLKHIVWFSGVAAALILIIEIVNHYKSINKANDLIINEYLVYETDLSIDEIEPLLSYNDLLEIEQRLIKEKTKKNL